MSKIILYAHGGSGNHGCEAIVRSTAAMLSPLQKELELFSSCVQEDARYGIDSLCRVIPDESAYSKRTAAFLKAYVSLKLTKNYVPMDKLSYRAAFSRIERGDIALSIGGDNYCYINVDRYGMLHDLALARGAKTVLWGCSVEPELVTRPEIAKDLARYSLITARETISYEALRSVNPNTILVADPAFTLGRDACAVIPTGCTLQNTVGINVSPMVMDNEQQAGAVMDNYRQLIAYILRETDMDIVLIPHVVWETGDDRRPLRTLYEAYRQSGRVFLAEDQTCEQLKEVISRCRFFVGARTHATIAAYSTGVPTLVVGYSVKARGIARDLFGTEEGYVLSAQSMRREGELTAAFVHLIRQEETIRTRLQTEMPGYMQKAMLAVDAVKRLDGKV